MIVDDARWALAQRQTLAAECDQTLSFVQFSNEKLASLRSEFERTTTVDRGQLDYQTSGLKIVEKSVQGPWANSGSGHLFNFLDQGIAVARSAGEAGENKQLSSYEPGNVTSGHSHLFLFTQILGG